MRRRFLLDWRVNSDSRIAGLFVRVICGAGQPQLYREADAILNICGAQELNEDLLACERLLYVESDPSVEQIKIDRGVRSTIDYLQRHHALFSFGENVGTKSFPVPTHGFKGHPTRQPIVSDFWRTTRA